MLREMLPEFCNLVSTPVEIKSKEPVSMEMDSHASDKDEICIDNAEVAFSDEEDDLNRERKKFHFHPIKETVVE